MHATAPVNAVTCVGAATRGRKKKTKQELEKQLDADPAFIKFQAELATGGKIRASTVPKLLKTVDNLLSKEYKMALLESTQRRAKDPSAVVEAVRQEALRKLMHEEDLFFDEGGQHNEFTMKELHERLDEATQARDPHHHPQDEQPGWSLPLPGERPPRRENRTRLPGPMYNLAPT